MSRVSMLICVLILFIICAILIYLHYPLPKQEVILQMDGKRVELINVGMLLSKSDGTYTINKPWLSNDDRYVSVIGKFENEIKQFIFDSKEEKLLEFDDSLLTKPPQKTAVGIPSNIEAGKWVSKNQYIGVEQKVFGAFSFFLRLLTLDSTPVTHVVKVVPLTDLNPLNDKVSRKLYKNKSSFYIWSYDNKYIYFNVPHNQKGERLFKSKVNFIF